MNYSELNDFLKNLEVKEENVQHIYKNKLEKEFNTFEALVACGINCFWHESDKYTLTSQGWIWAYPGQPGGRYSIAVHPEKLSDEEVKKFAGVCSDYVDNYNKEIQ